MIDASAEGDSVWVAAGQYKPNTYPLGCPECINSRFYTFFVKVGLHLFGNFAGTETDISQRDFSGSTTVLSGDLNGDDSVNGSFTEFEINGNTENIYHVLTVAVISSSNLPVTIDGFTIKGGNANGNDNYLINNISVTKFEGGGIFTRNQLTTITNCYIYHNSAKYGAGIFSYSQNTIINNNIIASNKANVRGGGIATDETINTISNNSIIGNSGFYDGGGIYCYNSESDYINNEISGNASEYDGGGISFLEGTNNIINNTISNNYAGQKGGAINTIYGTNTIKDNIIANNTANIDGGGLYFSTGINLVVNNVIYNNTGETHGGGMYISNSTIALTNNTIVRNSSNFSGGGIHAVNGTINYTNNIFWGNLKNSANNIASADVHFYYGTKTFKNNLFQLDSTLYTGINYSLGVNSQGNLFAQNPLFLNIDNPQGIDQLYFTEDDGLRLQTNSPALNAGILIDAPETDILGTIRDTQPDLGAYENGVPVGIQPITDSKPTVTLHAYPNPTSDAITFTFTTPIIESSSLLLYSIDGRNITSLYKSTTQAGETNTVTIDTTAFTPGTYCAVLRCRTGLAQHRTIIIK